MFEEAATEREPPSRAAALLAAAGAPVVVLDGADDVKVGDVFVLLCGRMVTCGSYAKEGGRWFGDGGVGQNPYLHGSRGASCVESAAA